MNSNPIPLTPSEWDEIASLPQVREAWGLESGDAGSFLSSVAYGARFAFVSGSPGYFGDLYVVVGDVLGNPPVLFFRNSSNKLQEVDYDD